LKKNTLRELSERFKEKVIDELKEEYNECSWKAFIKPLRVISLENNILTLFLKDEPVWVLRYYGERIKELLNEGIDESEKMKIKITNREKESQLPRLQGEACNCTPPQLLKEPLASLQKVKNYLKERR